jgi:hypothetical protein
MAVMLPGDDAWTDFGPGQDDSCQLCLGRVTEPEGEPVVVWNGPVKMWLHGGCAGSFVLRLARDAWQVERDADDGVHPLSRQRG